MSEGGGGGGGVNVRWSSRLVVCNYKHAAEWR